MDNIAISNFQMQEMWHGIVRVRGDHGFLLIRAGPNIVIGINERRKVAILFLGSVELLFW